MLARIQRIFRQEQKQKQKQKLEASDALDALAHNVRNAICGVKYELRRGAVFQRVQADAVLEHLKRMERALEVFVAQSREENRKNEKA